MPEIYFSTDIETDGPIPGEFSMLSLGSAAFNRSGELIASFSVNLERISPKQHPDTMVWWGKNMEAYQKTRVNQLPPLEAMVMFEKWVTDTSRGRGKPVFVAYPAGFDWTFVYWYLMKFAGHSPFGFQALDIKSFAMAKLGTEFRETVKKNMPHEWFPEMAHTHVAVEDAIEQGHLFVNMLRASGGHA